MTPDFLLVTAWSPATSITTFLFFSSLTFLSAAICLIGHSHTPCNSYIALRGTP
jgi:hypothetical protein